MDIGITAGLSKTIFYEYAHRCITAVNRCEKLRYHFPKTPHQIKHAVEGFKSVSTQGVMRGCVGAVDGLLIRTNAPRSREVGNVQSYYSGHYKLHGANCQALADHRCRFIYMSIQCPGGTNDARAYKNTTLPSLVEDLPIGKFIVGDAAYTVGEHLLTPFAGASRSEKKKDTYNYYLSQCRI